MVITALAPGTRMNGEAELYVMSRNVWTVRKGDEKASSHINHVDTIRLITGR